jgi:hypothetical protein
MPAGCSSKLANNERALPGQAKKKGANVSTPASNGPIPGWSEGSDGWGGASGGDVAFGVVPGKLHAASNTAAMSRMDFDIFMLNS